MSLSFAQLLLFGIYYSILFEESKVQFVVEGLSPHVLNSPPSTYTGTSLRRIFARSDHFFLSHMGYKKDIFSVFAYEFELSQKNLYSVNHTRDSHYIIPESKHLHRRLPRWMQKSRCQ